MQSKPLLFCQVLVEYKRNKGDKSDTGVNRKPLSLWLSAVIRTDHQQKDGVGFFFNNGSICRTHRQKYPAAFRDSILPLLCSCLEIRIIEPSYKKKLNQLRLTARWGGGEKSINKMKSKIPHNSNGFFQCFYINWHGKCMNECTFDDMRLLIYHKTTFAESASTLMPSRFGRKYGTQKLKGLWNVNLCGI